MVLFKNKLPDEEEPKTLRQKLAKFWKNRNVRYGVPFVILALAAQQGIQQFSVIRYEFRVTTGQSIDHKKEIERVEARMKPVNKRQSLEEMYEDIKKLDIDNWENIRGPRFFEEPLVPTEPSKK